MGSSVTKGRRRLRRAGLALMVLGALGLIEVGLTMFWQEPFSTWQARGKQAEVRRDVDRLLDAPVPAPVRRELARLDGDAARLALLAGRLRRSAQDGKGIGRIEIPSIDVARSFVEGTDNETLERGPGHYPETDLPGEDGTVGIAGHRTTYGAPFRHIDALDPRDRIVLTMSYGTFTYEVERTFEVTPDRVDVVKDVGRPRLVLSACTPLFSSARRIIVVARLVEVEPDLDDSGRMGA